MTTSTAAGALKILTALTFTFLYLRRRFDEEETRKHGLEQGEGLLLDAPATDEVELCVVLGGDGTILRALQRYVGTDVPVFAVNFGEIGFLATVEPEQLEDGIRRGRRDS